MRLSDYDRIHGVVTVQDMARDRKNRESQERHQAKRKRQEAKAATLGPALPLEVPMAERLLCGVLPEEKEAAFLRGEAITILPEESSRFMLLMDEVKAATQGPALLPGGAHAIQ
ncbi:hypothetical protein GALL_513320 [mine drainage metagenome]|uniref:Uncharacterized protein n=1 Tax=mine drainage metagenome TaxID=410659 RepID=A0A1J5PH31_9ZZZZ